jgi:hypothetical protein
MPALNTCAGLFWYASFPAMPGHQDGTNIGGRARPTYKPLQLPPPVSVRQLVSHSLLAMVACHFRG